MTPLMCDWIAIYQQGYISDLGLVCKDTIVKVL